MAKLQRVDEETYEEIVRLTNHARTRGIKLSQKELLARALEFLSRRQVEFMELMAQTPSQDPHQDLPTAG